MIPKTVTIMSSRNAVPGREYPEVSRKAWKAHCKMHRISQKLDKQKRS